jgi:hypothetical protein
MSAREFFCNHQRWQYGYDYRRRNNEPQQVDWHVRAKRWGGAAVMSAVLFSLPGSVEPLGHTQQTDLSTEQLVSHTIEK